MSSLKVKFKKLSESAVIPSYAKPGDAGMDLTCTKVSVSELENAIIVYHTDLAVEIPKGHVGLVFPRSSISKTNAILANSVGVIDSGYRGEILVKMRYPSRAYESSYKIGDRVAQLIVLPYPGIEPVEATQLGETERGEGGFGSTGA